MTAQHYDALTPDAILTALESVGFEPTGGLLALNSFENRVYQIALEDGSFVVAKFYRPERWSDAQILEEHAFTYELAEDELPIVTPLKVEDMSLFEYGDYRFSVYPRQGGHPPNIEVEEDLKVLARTIARIHAVGRRAPFQHRAGLTIARLGTESRDYLLQHNFLPMDVEDAYASLSQQLLDRLPNLDGFATSRIHGDCHLGNVLWRVDTPNFVDFDDCVTGPPVQDIWMLLSGERDERQRQLGKILEAYTMFAEFDYASLQLIEPLRSLRIMHHAAWIARRWDDPAFPLAFPTFGTTRYWSSHILDLREQMAALDEPPLTA